MSMLSPYQIVLCPDDRAALVALLARPTASQRQVLRARIVLAAADGEANTVIAARLGICDDTVRKWRRRFCSQGMAGLLDRPRAGRPPRYTPVQVAQLKAIACELPANRGVPLSRWSSIELACEAVEAGIVVDISPSTVRRLLAADALQPWRHHSWIFPRDPDFAAKAARVLDLYHRAWQGQPLGDGDYVVCADEKTSIQARQRRHPSLPAAPRRPLRVEHEYDRGGAYAYLAALDVATGTVTGRCESTTRIAPFTRLVDQVMTQEPYASANRVFWIVDNGSSHRGQAAADRLAESWPTAQMVHLPVHASWLNQIEIYFSIVQRKVLTPNDFDDLADVEARLAAFEDLYNLAARPFRWRYTKTDLTALLQRLARHDTASPPIAA